MVTASESTPKPTKVSPLPLLLAKYGTLVGLAIMIAAFSIMAPQAFPTTSNRVNILNQAALALIIAGGLTVTVIVGELDLSTGFAASFEGVLVTGLMDCHPGLRSRLCL